MHFVGLKEIQLKIDISHGRTQFDSGQAGVKWWLLLFDSLYFIDFKLDESNTVEMKILLYMEVLFYWVIVYDVTRLVFCMASTVNLISIST